MGKLPSQRVRKKESSGWLLFAHARARRRGLKNYFEREAGAAAGSLPAEINNSGRRFQSPGF